MQLKLDQLITRFFSNCEIISLFLNKITIITTFNFYVSFWNPIFIRKKKNLNAFPTLILHTIIAYNLFSLEFKTFS